MKRIFGFCITLCMLWVLIGCSGNDKDRATASSGSAPSLPNTAAGAEGAGVTGTEQAPQVDPSSSGGSTLPASTPYSQGKGSTVTQNVNPAPFLTSESAGGGAQRAASSTGLVARADGTMYGPSDQPAAGAGPGMQGTGQTSAGRGGNAGRGPGGGGLSAPVKPAANQTSGK